MKYTDRRPSNLNDVVHAILDGCTSREFADSEIRESQDSETVSVLDMNVLKYL